MDHFTDYQRTIYGTCLAPRPDREKLRCEPFHRLSKNDLWNLPCPTSRQREVALWTISQIIKERSMELALPHVQTERSCAVNHFTDYQRTIYGTCLAPRPDREKLNFDPRIAVTDFDGFQRTKSHFLDVLT